ncbi:putative glycolipid-binding domain-containing protein [Algiphilus sp.]|uniref:putative glycolipid-binding domain-containing protein n=1 Tax=Algiphilus sp. TaxID=1872431 RepID=UPI0032EC7E3E
MTRTRCRTLCWASTWNTAEVDAGLEHLLLTEDYADSVVLAFDESAGPFRLTYRLHWDEDWQIRDAELVVTTEQATRSLSLHTEGDGQWLDRDGRVIADLQGCLDIDIWPTPFTNTFPVRRTSLAIGERREFQMVWIRAPELTMEVKAQAYTRLSDRWFLYENLDGSGYSAKLPVDENGIVLDYLGLFRRVPHVAEPGDH